MSEAVLKSRTGHWLTDSVFDCAHERGKSVQETSMAVFDCERRASDIARKHSRAFADIERYFRALGYELELIKVQS